MTLGVNFTENFYPAEENGFGHIPLKFILEEGNFLYIMRETIAEEKIATSIGNNTGIGLTLGMLAGFVIGSCIEKKKNEDNK